MVKGCWVIAAWKERPRLGHAFLNPWPHIWRGRAGRVAPSIPSNLNTVTTVTGSGRRGVHGTNWC